jgi:hypothetical protein
MTGRAMAQKQANMPHKKRRRRRRRRERERERERERGSRRRRKYETLRSTFYGIMEDKML